MLSLSIKINMYIYIYICIYILVCVYIYIYMYIHIQNQGWLVRSTHLGLLEAELGRQLVALRLADVLLPSEGSLQLLPLLLGEHRSPQDASA